MLNKNIKRVLIISWLVVTHLLTTFGIYKVYKQANELDKLPEPDHSYFTVECLRYPLTLDECACIEDIISVLDEEDIARAVPIALKDCKLISDKSNN